MFKLQHKESPKRSLWLVGEKVNLGRHSSNDWVIDSLGVDDFHAEICVYPDYLILKSAGSSCFVNNLPVDKEFQLASGDELRIGNERLAVIDPKTLSQAEQQPPQAVIAEVAIPVAESHWALLPDHPTLQQRDFTISGRCVLGRSSNCEFAIPYKLLSREHAALTVVNNVLILEDLGSSNGCFVNGKQVNKVAVKAGDKVSFAKLTFRIQAPTEGSLQPSPGVDSRFRAGNDEANKTIIRPAVDMQAALAKERFDQGRKGAVSVKFEQQPLATDPTEHQASWFVAKRWPLWSAVGVLGLVGLWFSPLNTL